MSLFLSKSSNLINSINFYFTVLLKFWYWYFDINECDSGYLLIVIIILKFIAPFIL